MSLENPSPSDFIFIEDDDSEEECFYSGAAQNLAFNLWDSTPTITQTSDLAELVREDDEPIDLISEEIDSLHESPAKTRAGKRKSGRTKRPKEPEKIQEIEESAPVLDILTEIGNMSSPLSSIPSLVTKKGKRRKGRMTAAEKERLAKEEERQKQLLKKWETIKQLQAIEDKLKQFSEKSDQDDVLFISEEKPGITEDFEDNQEIPVKILFRGSVVRIGLRKYQKFHCAFEELAKQANEPISSVLIFHNNKKIKHEDTPSDLGVTIADILEAGICKNDEPSTQNRKLDQDRNTLELKVQCPAHRRAILVRIRKTDCMQVLMHKYAEEVKVDVAKMSFKFDGEHVNASDTPEDLDMEGGECVDVFY